MRIPMAALRRALSEMAQGGRAVFRDTGLPGVPLGNAAVGGVAGGIIGEGGNPYDDTDGGHGVEGALIGAALGGGVGLAGGLGRAAGNLREALAARAAERGMGRAVSRVAGDMDDAAQFHSSLPGNRQALRNLPQDRVESAIQRLQAQRQYATHPDEIADLDAQIEELTRMLGGGM